MSRVTRKNNIMVRLSDQELNQIQKKNVKNIPIAVLIRELVLMQLEPSNSEPSNSEPSNSEPSNSEPSNSEPSNSEPSNSEPSNSEPSNSEPSNSEPLPVKAPASVPLQSTKEVSSGETKKRLLQRLKELETESPNYLSPNIDFMKVSGKEFRDFIERHPQWKLSKLSEVNASFARRFELEHDF